MLCILSDKGIYRDKIDDEEILEVFKLRQLQSFKLVFIHSGFHSQQVDLLQKCLDHKPNLL